MHAMRDQRHMGMNHYAVLLCYLCLSNVCMMHLLYIGVEGMWTLHLINIEEHPSQATAATTINTTREALGRQESPGRPTSQ